MAAALKQHLKTDPTTKTTRSPRQFDAALAAKAFGDAFVAALCGRLESAAAADPAALAHLKAALHWVYAGQPERRPALRIWVGTSLAAFARFEGARDSGGALKGQIG